MLPGISQILGKLRVNSALNPALWFCGIVLIPSIWLASRQDRAPIWLIVLIYLAVLVPAIGYFVLLFVDRDKLQSEDYQIRKQSLELIQEKGEPIPVDAKSIEAIALPKLDNKNGEVQNNEASLLADLQ